MAEDGDEDDEDEGDDDSMAGVVHTGTSEDAEGDGATVEEVQEDEPMEETADEDHAEDGLGSDHEGTVVPVAAQSRASSLTSLTSSSSASSRSPSVAGDRGERVLWLNERYLVDMCQCAQVLWLWETAVRIPVVAMAVCPDLTENA